MDGNLHNGRSDLPEKAIHTDRPQTDNRANCGCPEKARLADIAVEAHSRLIARHRRVVEEIKKGNFGPDEQLDTELVEWHVVAERIIQTLRDHVAKHGC